MAAKLSKANGVISLEVYANMYLNLRGSHCMSWAINSLWEVGLMLAPG